MVVLRYLIRIMLGTYPSLAVMKYVGKRKRRKKPTYKVWSFKTFDILLVVMVIKVNRFPDHRRQKSHKTHIMMRKLAKVTYFRAKKLQIKSFSTLIGHFCDWLLEITVQTLCKSSSENQDCVFGHFSDEKIPKLKFTNPSKNLRRRDWIFFSPIILLLKAQNRIRSYQMRIKIPCHTIKCIDLLIDFNNCL